MEGGEEAGRRMGGKGSGVIEREKERECAREREIEGERGRDREAGRSRCMAADSLFCHRKTF